MLDVFAALLRPQRRKAIQQRDSLLQLRKLAAGQFVGEFRLSRENDLQQLGSRSFEIRKQSDRLQHGRMQILCLIYDNDEAPSGTRLLQEELVKFVVHADKI